MSTFAITYDLRRPGKDYGTLIKVLQAMPGAVHYQQSAWFARWSGSSAQLRDALLQYIDVNDWLMVMKVSEAAWHPAIAKGPDIIETFKMAA